MQTELITLPTARQAHNLKRITAMIYLCQMLTFVLAGVPFFLCLALYYYKRREVRGTWLQSHFAWQIHTLWGVLIGLTVALVTFAMPMGVYVVVATVIWLIYRVSIGWFALTDGKAIDDKTRNSD